MMIKRTTEMEQQFNISYIYFNLFMFWWFGNTYIAALTESLDKSEKTLDTVQDLLYQMIKRIDEGQMDVRGARKYLALFYSRILPIITSCNIGCDTKEHIPPIFVILLAHCMGFILIYYFSFELL